MPTTPATDAPGWDEAPVADLVQHIRETYHQRMRDELQQAAILADRVADRHADVLPMLTTLRQMVLELRTRLDQHLEREAAAVFSEVIHLVQTRDVSTDRVDRLTSALVAMSDDHDEIANAFEDIRRVTSGYEPPMWACPTFRTFYDTLSHIEHRLRLQLHLEDHVLFPRALALIRSRRSSSRHV